MRNEYAAWAEMEAAEDAYCEAELALEALGLPALPCPDGGGTYSADQMVAYCIADRDVRPVSIPSQMRYLPCEPPSYYANSNAYAAGHRDALRAAANLLESL